MQPRNNRRPSQSPRTEGPEQRLLRLNNRLSHVLLVKEVTDSEGWREVENTLRALIKKKRIAQSSINWDDAPEKFLAFKERSTYMAGWIQGAEYILNDVRSGLQEEAQLRKDIKATEAELKKSKRRA